MKTNEPKIVGDGWTLHIEEGYLGWDISAPDGGIPDAAGFKILGMVKEEFPAQRIVDEYDEKHIITWGTRFGPLYDDALEFLHKWGVKCEGVDLPEMEGESGPYDENNPAPAD